MLTELRPHTGADFMRLDLATIKQGLETLRDDGELAGGYLTPEQCLWFNRYVSAWDEYRPIQTPELQAEVEGAIGVIFGYQIENLAARAA